MTGQMRFVVQVPRYAFPDDEGRPICAADTIEEAKAAANELRLTHRFAHVVEQQTGAIVYAGQINP